MEFNKPSLIFWKTISKLKGAIGEAFELDYCI
jgi:hypothetical protein